MKKLKCRALHFARIVDSADEPLSAMKEIYTKENAVQAKKT